MLFVRYVEGTDSLCIEPSYFLNPVHINEAIGDVF